MSKEQLEKLKEHFGENLGENVPFSGLTTVSIGGPARAFLTATTIDQLIEILQFVKVSNIEFLIIGGGSNLLVSDEGVDKLVIKVATSEIAQEGEVIKVAAGTILQDLVNFSLEEGLSGIHKMTGIPGCISGAIYGNAGAYGQTISDYLVNVRAYDVSRDQIISLTKTECSFEYRDSGFKKTGLIILEAFFNFPKGEKELLQQESDQCLQLRLKKYLPGVKCPGSFFRNFFTSEVSDKARALLPPREDTFGKTPAYIFIEGVGLKGKQVGNIKIADYHGNLFINLGEGKASDFWKLAKECYDSVKEKYGVELQPEVQLINLPPLNI